MTLKTLAKATLLLSSLVSLSALAEDLSCPSAVLIKTKAAALDTVTRLKEKSYLVYTASDTVYDPTTSAFWSIGTFTNTNDFNSAYVAGGENIRTVSTLKEAQSKRHQNTTIYLCYYLSASTGTVNTFALTTSDGPQALPASFQRTLLADPKLQKN